MPNSCQACISYDPDTSECRHDPPVMSGSLMDWDGEYPDRQRGVWPYVEATEWCRQWELSGNP